MLNKSCLHFSSLAFLTLFSFCAQAINPNTATVEELADELLGIGPKLATKIVEYREKNGNFQNIDDLMQVKGIAGSVIDKNKDLLEFGE